MRYINQWEYPDWFYRTHVGMEDSNPVKERAKGFSVAGSGCGLCSAIMVADRLLVDKKFELEDALELSYESGGNWFIGTDYRPFAPAFAEKMGLDLEMTNDPERLRYCLRTGGCAVINSGGDKEGYVGVFTHGGHYIVAINEEPDGRIAILDPAFTPDRYEEPGRKGKVEVKHGIFALCDIQVLVDDASNRDPGFFLFWRK